MIFVFLTYILPCYLYMYHIYYHAICICIIQITIIFVYVYENNVKINMKYISNTKQAGLSRATLDISSRFSYKFTLLKLSPSCLNG